MNGYLVIHDCGVEAALKLLGMVVLSAVNDVSYVQQIFNRSDARLACSAS
jgi:hypothetical protein